VAQYYHMERMYFHIWIQYAQVFNRSSSIFALCLQRSCLQAECRQNTSLVNLSLSKHFVHPTMAKKKRSTKETFERNYWTAEELEILRRHRDHWLSEKTAVRRTAYELGTVAVAIAELNPSKYGSEVIEKDPQLKKKWLRRCKVRKGGQNV